MSMVNTGQQVLEIKTLKSIFRSESYVEELTELSAYGAHIKQERPMCYLLAKHLYRRGFVDLSLEKTIERHKWYDLVVGNTKIEAKFYYESDLLLRLKKEMEKFEWNINLLTNRRASLIREGKSKTWSMVIPIAEDMLMKDPDIFLLIILSRDLRSASVPLEQICWSKYEINYNREYGYNNKDSLELVDKFFNCVRQRRAFSSDYLRVDVDNGLFPSTYHIYLCNFRN
jgi:hypothetical protein